MEANLLCCCFGTRFRVLTSCHLYEFHSVGYVVPHNSVRFVVYTHAPPVPSSLFTSPSSAASAFPQVQLMLGCHAHAQPHLIRKGPRHPQVPVGLPFPPALPTRLPPQGSWLVQLAMLLLPLPQAPLPHQVPPPNAHCTTTWPPSPTHQSANPPLIHCLSMGPQNSARSRPNCLIGVPCPP